MEWKEEQALKVDNAVDQLLDTKFKKYEEVRNQFRKFFCQEKLLEKLNNKAA